MEWQICRHYPERFDRGICNRVGNQNRRTMLVEMIVTIGFVAVFANQTRKVKWLKKQNADQREVYYERIAEKNEYIENFVAEIEILKQQNLDLKMEIELHESNAELRMFLATETLNAELKEVIPPNKPSEKIDPFVSIGDLQEHGIISTSTFNILANYGIINVHELSKITAKQVANWRNVGEYHLGILAELLMKAGLSFATEKQEK